MEVYMRTCWALVVLLALASCSRHEDQQASQSASAPDRGAAQPSISYATSIRDTVVDKSFSLGENLPAGRVVYSVKVKPPHNLVLWTICAIVGNDTAFFHTGDSAWFKPDGEDSSSQKLSWYTRDFFAFDRDSIAVGDERRRISEMLPRETIARYLQELGMAAAAANAAETSFWTYYRDLPIITFVFRDFPTGGDLRPYAYHPRIRWFVPVELPQVGNGVTRLWN
jgi:hypothetical protein